jgi:hypothetical protein
MVCKRYIIIENYPSIIVDKMPIMHILKFLVYINLYIYYIFKDLYTLELSLDKHNLIFYLFFLIQ